MNGWFIVIAFFSPVILSPHPNGRDEITKKKNCEYADEIREEEMKIKFTKGRKGIKKLRGGKTEY